VTEPRGNYTPVIVVWLLVLAALYLLQRTFS
jgi:hypothetical protein